MVTMPGGRSRARRRRAAASCRVAPAVSGPTSSTGPPCPHAALAVARTAQASPTSCAAQENAVVEMLRVPAGRRRAGRAVRRRRAPALPGRRQRARRAARPAGQRPGLHHRRAARAVLRAASRAGPTRCGTPASRSARSAPPRRGVTCRDHHVPRRRLRPRDPQPGRRVRRHHRGRPRAPRLHRQRDGRRADRRTAHRSSTRTAGSPRWPRGVLDTPADAGGVVRRRPAADAARGPLRLPARARRPAPRVRRGDDGDGGRARPDHRASGCRPSCPS